MFTLNSAPRLLQFLACAVFSLAVSNAYAVAGKIQFVAGEAKVTNDKQAERAAIKGLILNQGDSIVTGPTGSVQVLLEDGGLLAVRPNTQMKIDAYAYSGKADDPNNKSFFSLGKGTFRSITGAIGQNNKQAYRVDTPTATMGIRGTDHEPAVVLQLAPGQQAQSPLESAPPGTYDRVNQGQTFIQNSAGLLVLGVNQVGFAPSGGGAPTVLPNVPAFYTSTPKPVSAKNTAQSTSSASSSNSTTTAAAAGSSDSSSTSTSDSASLSTTSSSSIEPDPTVSFATLESTTIVTNSTSVNTDTTVTTDPIIAVAAGITESALAPAPLLGGVGAYIAASAMGGQPSSGSVLLTAASPTQEILLGAQNEVLRIFDGLTSPTFEFLSNGSSLSTSDPATTFVFNDGGIVNWGRWLPGFIVKDGGIVEQTLGDFQYIFSQNITSPSLVTSGTLTGGLYGYVGGTSPANALGVTGTINPLNTFLSVDFGGQTAFFSVETSISGVTLSGSASGSIRDFINPLSGISSITSSVFVFANGFFVGPTAAGAITSFTIQDITNGNGAAGTAVFRR